MGVLEAYLISDSLIRHVVNVMALDDFKRKCLLTHLILVMFRYCVLHTGVVTSLHDHQDKM